MSGDGVYLWSPIVWQIRKEFQGMGSIVVDLGCMLLLFEDIWNVIRHRDFHITSMVNPIEVQSTKFIPIPLTDVL